MKPYYQDEWATIYHGDCLDVLPSLSGFDMLAMDPPYTAAGGSTNGRTSEVDSQFFLHWFRDAASVIQGSMTASAKGFVFADWKTVGIVAEAFRSPGSRQRQVGWSCKQALVWDRDGMGMGSPFRNGFEMIAVVAAPEARWTMPRNITTVVRHRWTYGRHQHHGAEKPVALLEQLIEWADPKTRLLDPFTGSGTALLAAKRRGLKSVGIEISERNCEIAAGRLSELALLSEAVPHV